MDSLCDNGAQSQTQYELQQIYRGTPIPKEKAVLYINY